MAEYIRARAADHSPEATAVEALRTCGRYLEWRHFYVTGKSALTKARTCKKHHLCPMCASLRGLRMAASYRDRVELVMRGDASLSLRLITVTVKDGGDLAERFEHLHKAWRILRQRAHRGNAPTVWDRIAGAVWSFEAKRGANSGLWHPHLHALCLVRGDVAESELKCQWHAITGDSFVVDVRPLTTDQAGAFCEVFKYALKFSDLPLADNFDAWVTLRGRRLVASSGVLRGIPEPDLMDPLEDDPRAYDLLFYFVPDLVHGETGEIVPARYEFAAMRLPPQGRGGE